MKGCPMCGGKMFKRLYILIDNATDSDQRQVDFVCLDCGSSVSTYNQVPILFDRRGLFITAAPLTV